MNEHISAIAAAPPAHAGSDLIRSLCSTGAYRTPAGGRRVGLSRLLGRWDVWVYWRIARVIIGGARAARRGRHDAAQWSGESETILRVIEAGGGRVTVTGMAPALRLDGPVVYVGNHMSMLETCLLPGILMAHGDLSFVLKESLLAYPFFGPLLQATHPIAVGRRDPRADLKLVLSRGPELLRAGRSVVVFPQSTRSTTFVPREFNTLGVKLAERSGVPVVPFALKTDFMGVGRIVRDCGALNRTLPIHLRFAAPVRPPFKSRDAHHTVVHFIRECLTEWGGRIDEEDRKPEAQTP